MPCSELELCGPKPPADFVSDGCSFVPDGWWRPACHWHDWAYRSDVKISRLKADWCLFRNMRRLHAPLTVALLYLVGVRIFGRFFFRAAYVCWWRFFDRSK